MNQVLEAVRKFTFFFFDMYAILFMLRSKKNTGKAIIEKRKNHTLLLRTCMIRGQCLLICEKLIRPMTAR